VKGSGVLGSAFRRSRLKEREKGIGQREEGGGLRSDVGGQRFRVQRFKVKGIRK